MANERITEDIVDKLLHELGAYDNPAQVTVEKQQSEVDAIRAALAG